MSSSNPAPRWLALEAALIGAFGVIAYALSLSSSVSHHITGVAGGYFLVASLLTLWAGVELWRPSRRGWWLTWTAMAVVAASGLLPWQPGGLSHVSYALRAGVMMMAAGWYFAELSHPGVYVPCFGPRGEPAGLVLGAPIVLMAIGGAVAAVDPRGRLPVVGIVVVLLGTGRLAWMTKPLHNGGSDGRRRGPTSGCS